MIKITEKKYSHIAVDPAIKEKAHHKAIKNKKALKNYVEELIKEDLEVDEPNE